MSMTLFLAMLICFAFSISIAVSIGASAMLGLTLFDPTRLIVAPKEMFTAIDKFPLAAIPFFILAGWSTSRSRSSAACKAACR